MGKFSAIAATSGALLFAATIASGAGRSSCVGIDRHLAKSRAQQLSERVAQQFHDPGATVSDSFKLQGWTVVIVDFTNSDPGFVFYRGDPRQEPYVTVWSGAAAVTEEDQRQWAFKNARGIPPQLAACFAWYTTKSGNW
jgi:hypothetical protein